MADNMEESHDRVSRPVVQKPISRRSFLRGMAAVVVGLGLGGCSSSKQSKPKKQGPHLATVTDKVESSSITLMMVGDMLAHTSLIQSGKLPDGSINYDHLFTHMADDFKNTDIAMINQETILGTTDLSKTSGYPTFNSPQQIGDAEAKAGIDVVTCATNHAMDQGFNGIKSEVEFWKNNHPEMVVTGIFENEEDARKIPVVERNGVKVALLNYTEQTNGIPLPADAPWCVKMFATSDIASDVVEARKVADFVVAIAHWGTEYVYTPNDFQRQKGQELADAGVDAIIGGHPHVIENVDILNGKDGKKVPCFWSIGNYASTQSEKPRMLGGMAKLTLQKTGKECKVTEWSMTPLVTHQTRGNQNFGTYKLSDYTEELASQNWIRNYGASCADFTRAYVNDLAAQLLGSGYDKDACVLKGTL